jgi:DNA-binding MarR family transcriptional regulator/GNAT superfamily N-acetyltransferase
MLRELSQCGHATAADLCQTLGLDAGYVSRILIGFEQSGVIAREPSETDRRKVLISLSEKGREVFASLDERAEDDIAELLSELSLPDRQRVVAAFNMIAQLLFVKKNESSCWVLRSHQPGDMGWVIGRHAAVYAAEYGYDERYEALVARLVSDFLTKYDVRRERCWIAEQGGQPVGSVFLMADSKHVARLRMLFVDPSARGLGIGKRLVEESVQFAERAGYGRIVLWTQRNLSTARHLYARAGFAVVSSKQHDSWGPKLIGENWELKLRTRRHPVAMHRPQPLTAR